MNGVTTRYLVDDLNPTGYAQVVEETGGVNRTYTYGLQRISEDQVVNNTWTPSFYGYDGMGSVRQLTNSAGAVTDRYEYDAFGNLLNKTGTTPNEMLYRGEQWDSDLGLYYLWARWYDPATGRFMSRDPGDGVLTNPETLNKYLYTDADPEDLADPTGNYAEAAPIPGRVGGGGDELGIYAGLIGAIAITQVPHLRAIGQELNCIFIRAATTIGGIAANIGFQMTFENVGGCMEYVQGHRRPSDKVIIYQTTSPPPNCGAFGLRILDESKGGLPISWTGMHQGLLRDGIVYDNMNPEGIPLAQWLGGEYSVPLACNLGSTTTGSLNDAVARGIGTVTIE